MRLQWDESSCERTSSRSWIVVLYCLSNAKAGEAAQRLVKANRKGCSTPCRLNPQTLLSAFLATHRCAANWAKELTHVPIPPFRGSITALITPFNDGKLDERAFQRHVDWQIDQGTHGLVPCGTTGESPTLSHDEHKRVVELCIEAAAGRVPGIAGAGANFTAGGVRVEPRAER